jgi:hypothetical protein
MKVKFHSVEAAPIARFVDDEGWSYGAVATLSILDSIETAVAWGKETENATVLSVVFGGYKTRPMRLHGGDLFGLFKRVHWHSVHGSEVCLVAKTRALGELSDWRDLQFFVGSASMGVLEWVGHVRAVYRSYVLRPAFAMPEPRPALLEAAHLTRATVTHRTFFPEDICVMGARARNSAVELQCSSPRAVTIKCYDDSDLSAHAACLSLSPLYIGTWHGKLEMHLAKDLSEQLQVPKRDWSTRLPHGMHHGVQALRRNTSSTEPGKYCWATGKPGQQRPPDAWIHNSDNTSRRFDSAANPPPKVNWRIGLASGAFGARSKIGKYLHQHISKAYYAARHGYSYHVELSNKFVTYMHMDAMLKKDWYSRAVLSKPLMVLSMMHRLPDTDWLFFTDEDVHINAQWTHYPLDAWLADVPADKVFVHTNYRSLMSGAFFIRNSAEGRQFVRDWIAVIMSGFIGCHGWDQAALEVLFFLRQTEGGDAHWSERPYGFDCMESGSVYRGINGTGCADGHSWSCDYMFERKLEELGFWNTIGIDGFFKSRFSSYSRGCANDAVRDFHVVPETSTRPRLQCFHCTDHSEIGTGVWDGMLGGGNDLVRSGAIDSYFTGHKSDWVFHEQWLEDDACSRLDGFLPTCPRDVLYHTARKPGRLLSMFDGWAYDIKKASFCAVDASHAEVRKQTCRTAQPLSPTIIILLILRLLPSPYHLLRIHMHASGTTHHHVYEGVP